MEGALSEAEEEGLEQVLERIRQVLEAQTKPKDLEAVLQNAAGAAAVMSHRLALPLHTALQTARTRCISRIPDRQRGSTAGATLPGEHFLRSSADAQDAGCGDLPKRGKRRRRRRQRSFRERGRAHTSRDIRESPHERLKCFAESGPVARSCRLSFLPPGGKGGLNRWGVV